MGDQNCGSRPQIQVASQSSISLDETVRAVEFPNIDGQCQPIHDSQLVGLPVAVTGDSVVRSEETTASSVELKTEVKRKRGRPPRGQAKPRPAKKQKEEDEDVCFICFDGGSLVLCDRRGCPKAYHPACIKRDEAFFQSKARWNCGWHICSVCQKSAHYMCYTCTYSLCKGCTKDADYLCVRGDKGFCITCMKTVMLIENKEQGNKEMAQVDFDDKSSWEYLFKVYWIYLKGKLSLTLKDLAEAKNPCKESGIMAFKGQSPGVHVGTNDVKSSFSDRFSGYLEGNNSIRRKSNESLNKLNEDSSTEKSCNEKDASLIGCTEWATKDLLDFVAYMRNGDTSVLSQFDVQALLLDYIKRNNLRDPRRKSYILCDLKLKTLFGKQCVGHFEMLKLLEFHFLVKEEPPKDVFIQGGVVDINAIQVLADENNNNLIANDKKRKTRKKGEEHAPQTNLNEYAAIDVHNINLIYLRRDLMENLIEDKDKFHDKVVGSVVRIRISGGEQKQDMYRLVQVVGTTKVPVPYKFSNMNADVMLEVLNLDKKEAVSIDAISNQDFSKDECRRLRQSIKCGLVKRFTVGEIQEKAMALQAVRLNDWLETEMLRLNHLRDRASENGRKKELRECVEKLQLLKTPEEHQRRLCQIPEVHCDPNMDPNYESEEDAGETDKRKQGEYVKPRYTGYNREGNKPISLRNRGDFSGDSGTRAWSNSSPSCEQSKNMYATSYPDKEESAAKALQRLREGKDAWRSNISERPGNEIDSNGLGIGGWNNQAVSSSTTLSSIASEPSTASLSMSNSPSAYNSETKLWHYRDPNGKIQGPFCMVQLQKWSTTGYFPPDMRIWAGDRQDDSILLAAALNGQFHKVLPFLNDISSQLQEVGGASDSKLYNSDFGRSENVNATRDGNQTEGHWHGNIATIHSNNNNDLARSDRWGAQSSVWTAPVISYKKETTAGSCSQDQDSFKGNSFYYNLLKLRSPLSSSTLSGAEYATHSHHEINHEVKRCNSDPYHENWISHGTTVNKITGGHIFENHSNSRGFSGQSSEENLRHSPVKFSLNNLDLNSTFFVTKSTDSPDQNGEMNTTNLHSPSRKTSNGDWEGEAAENKESVSSSVNVHDSDMPSPTPNTSNEYQKCQTVENKQYASSNVPIQDSGPSWSSASSLVVGGAQLADITDEWGGYSPTPVKRSVEEWDSNLVSVLSLKPPEGHVPTTTSTSGELSHFSLSQPASNISSWQTVSEPIEFSTLAEESVSDLLAEVDAMESQGGLASPTSVMKCGAIATCTRFLDIEDKPWPGLKETVGTSSTEQHVGSFLRLLAEENGDTSKEVKDQERALSKAVDAMSSTIETSVDFESKKEKHREYEHECREKFSTAETEKQSQSEVEHKGLEDHLDKKGMPSSVEQAPIGPSSKCDEKPFKEISMLGYQRKVAVLYELLSACLALTPEANENATRRRQGYDARHRVALRLLATWFDVKWIKMEAIETIIASSAMAILKEEQSKEEETETPKSSMAKWKRGGIIGAAALTGGTLMAITGGLAAPAIAAGFSALAPTLGTIIPVIGASGFAAAATAAGSVAGSVAVAASFGAAGAGLTGVKMARRTGDIEEFGFKVVGENHNQGRLAVEILVSGFVFRENDFVRPWEGQTDNSERYALQWESKNLIAVSTAIQDWLTSQLAMEMMKQGAMLTVLSTLLTALAWPAALFTLTDLIDSKWSIAVDRSDKAGKLLAEDVLLKGLQGNRPVTLIGFSLGARVIFRCLQVLAAAEHSSGLVERVVLLGTPIAIKDENWEAARKVVSGRFVNAYSTNDWMLGVAFRAGLLTKGLAGIQPINIPGIENVDVTELVEGHSSYLWTTQQILEKLQLDNYFPASSATFMKL